MTPGTRERDRVAYGGRMSARSPLRDCALLVGLASALASPAPSNAQGTAGATTIVRAADVATRLGRPPRFLIGMGYPQASLRDPRDASLSMSSATSSATLAGMVAWHYEQTGLRPMLIGHSRGGMLVVRTLP